MTSEELAEIIVNDIRNNNECTGPGLRLVSKEDLDKLQRNIEIFLLRKFEEGMHVGRDHSEKK